MGGDFVWYLGRLGLSNVDTTDSDEGSNELRRFFGLLFQAIIHISFYVRLVGWVVYLLPTCSFGLDGWTGTIPPMFVVLRLVRRFYLSFYRLPSLR